MAGPGLSAALVKSFVTSIASILIPVALGGTLGAKEIIKLPHVDGMMIYIFWVGLPALVFRRLALSDPHTLDMRLLGADALSKIIPLGFLLLWRRFLSKSGRVESFEWVITFFMLSNIPNTVLIGDAVLNPLFGVEIETKTTAIIFAQSLYWYNACIVLLEIRELIIEDEKSKHALPIVCATVDKSGPMEKSSAQSMDREKRNLEPTFNSGYRDVVHGADSEDGCSCRSCSSRSFSIHSPADSLAQSFSSAAFKIAPIDDHFRDEKLGTASGRAAHGNESADAQADQVHSIRVGHFTPRSKTLAVARPSPQSDYASRKQQQLRDFENERALRQLELELGRSLGMDSFRPINEESGTDDEGRCCTSRCSCWSSCASRASFVKSPAIRILKRVFKTPLIYASVSGLAYSLFAVRHNWTMPSFLATTLSFVADGTIGLAMVAIGVISAAGVLALKSLRGVVPCGMKWLLVGFAARYIAAPFCMYISSLAVVLKGTVLRYAIVQVLIAQGIVGFALAKQYNCKVSIMLAATIVQMISFIPVTLAYYALVETI